MLLISLVQRKITKFKFIHSKTRFFTRENPKGLSMPLVSNRTRRNRGPPLSLEGFRRVHFDHLNSHSDTESNF